MARKKIRELTPKALSALLFVVLVIITTVFWASYHFIKPFPPRSMVMATGMQGGGFAVYGERYQKALAREGINLVLRPSSGAVENLKLLNDESQEIDAGFVQGGVGKPEASMKLMSLGGLAYTPLWVFYRGDEILDDLSQLAGKKIVVGPGGSGVNKFALELLKMANVSEPPAKFLDYPYAEAKKAILEGSVDAVMVIGAADNELVLDLLNAAGIKLMNLSQAEAYTRFFPELSHVILPQGVLNPSRRIPSQDIHLLSATTNLIVRKDLHPALVYLLLKASVEIHRGAGLVNRTGEFPTLNNQDFPVGEQAKRFYKQGSSLIYEYLPFWIATFVDRMLLILVPMGIVLIPLIGIMPWIYTWQNRSKYYRWYRELRNLEKELTDGMLPDIVREFKTKLDRLEDAVSKVRVSVAFYDEVFILKEHIQMVRNKFISAIHSVSTAPDHDRQESRSAETKKDSE
jgi:TRAP-type uncharacterized transport system substrate-binding protein